MKKQLLLINGFLCLTSLVFGGGIVTNTNQSAAWVRTLVRDASTDIDAVYYNPAGLVKMNDGFHFSLNNQTVFVNKDVTSNYPYLLPAPPIKFPGDIKAPIFPGIYTAWKRGNLAISFGFNPIGGGAGATYEKGLPSFVVPISDLRKGFESSGAMDYRMDAFLKGVSVYYGYQFGLSYKINDMISVFGGLRYVSVKNTYEGHLKDIELLMGENWIPASYALMNVSTMLSGAASDLQNAITAGYIGADDPVSEDLSNSLLALGIDPTGFTNGAAVGALQYASAEYEANASLVSGQEVDVTQKGTGFTPIIGVDISLGDKLNIGLKYEFKTKMQVVNDTKKDFTLGFTPAGVPITMFPDGEKIDSDLPAMMSVGVDYQVLPKLSATVGFHYYWDKTASYGKELNDEYVDNSEVIDNNCYEAGIGLEYDIIKSLRVSAGYLFAKSGVSEAYQSDFSFDLSSNTIGVGIGLKFTDRIMVNAGVSYTMFNEGKKNYEHEFPAPGNPVIPVTDTYFQDVLILGLGVDFSF
jgi:long-chain fatty acid transport protein